MRKRKTEEIREIVGDLGYKLLDEYQEKRNGIRRVVIQDIHGCKYSSYLNHLMGGVFPPIAETRNPFSLSNISLWLKKEKKPFVLCENNVYKGSSEKLFFQCLKEECQEIFDMSWREVYSNDCGCPYCSGKRVGKRNNLACRRPELVAEWDYEKNKRNPEEYTEFTNERVSWICSKSGHLWDATINHRSNGSGCPKCADLQRESAIANELKVYFKGSYKAIPEYKILKNPDTGYWLPYDIYIAYGDSPDFNGFYIEIHGLQHYYKLSGWYKKEANRKGTTSEEEFEYQKHKDRLKRRFARKNGTYIEIDLRKIKTAEEAIKYIENILESSLL